MFIPMEQSTKEILRMILGMALANLLTKKNLMQIIMLDSSMIATVMVMESRFGKMVKCTRENGRMMSAMAREHCAQPMAASLLRGSGLMVNQRILRKRLKQR